eukprot:1009037-Prorocentrum_minimum.AAC.3
MSAIMPAITSREPLVASARLSLSSDRGSTNPTLRPSRQHVARTPALFSLQRIRHTRSLPQRVFATTYDVRCRALKGASNSFALWHAGMLCPLPASVREQRDPPRNPP